MQKQNVSGQQMDEIGDSGMAELTRLEIAHKTWHGTIATLVSPPFRATPEELQAIQPRVDEATENFRIAFLENDLELSVSEKLKSYLLDNDNPYFLYDLLGVLKADTKFFYIEADEELLTAEELVKVSLKFGAIPAWSYLGDIGDSVTGDKRTQKFEDDYLPELGAAVKEIGFQASAYAPTRNTSKQLENLLITVRKHNLLQISGEDINTPRQEFTCPILARPEFRHLTTSTWALIGHEKLSFERGLDYGIFGKKTIEEFPDLLSRVEHYAKIGKQTVK